jgi:CMP-2-keto-3-deoxyoctulosonic acid synthetase
MNVSEGISTLPTIFIRFLPFFCFSSSLEKLEKLEQLRAIENGYTILVGKVRHTCEGIDTPEQYAAFVKRYLRHMRE